LLEALSLNKKVLVIDDDPDLGKLIAASLKPLELSIYQAYSGEDGLMQAYTVHPDLVILDIIMPGLGGFDVCSRLRELSSFPILMLTACAHENDMLHSFKVGVDDFLRKPFSKNELEARVRVLLRRSSNKDSAELSYINAYTDSVLQIDLSIKTVKLKGNLVDLSPKEYDLLACLVREPGKIISHRELVRAAWGEPYISGPAESSLYIHYLRNKLKDGQYGHKYIHTLWGRGYWFAPRKSD
jgi:DNA-binding response OmpR family regulator